jgi:hypothetical protein
LCYYIGQITPIGIPDKKRDLSHTGGNIIDAEAGNLSPFISGCPMKPNYNCMLLADRWADVSNKHRITLSPFISSAVIRLPRRRARSARTSSPMDDRPVHGDSGVIPVD